MDIGFVDGDRRPTLVDDRLDAPAPDPAGRPSGSIEIRMLDHPVIVAGLRAQMSALTATVNVVDLQRCVAPPTSGRASVVFVDPVDGPEFDDRARFSAGGLDVPLVAYTWSPDDPRCSDEAAGYVAAISKNASPDAIVRLVEQLTGQTAAVRDELTEREREVLDGLVHGWSNREIASSLCVSTDTVKTHLRRLYRKIGVRNRTEAARFGLTGL